jgi:hypothetical protein
MRETPMASETYRFRGGLGAMGAGANPLGRRRRQDCTRVAARQQRPGALRPRANGLQSRNNYNRFVGATTSPGPIPP